jgi:hypothetical protein
MVASDQNCDKHVSAFAINLASFPKNAEEPKKLYVNKKLKINQVTSQEVILSQN